MNTPRNRHSKFFSSLNQVQKRLKLEINSSPQTQCPSTDESLGSPIFFHKLGHQPNQTSTPEFSETPQQFLSVSNDFPSTHQHPSQGNPQDLPEIGSHFDDSDVDEIGLLIDLLGISDTKENDPNLEGKPCCSCHCDGGFYDKIVGVKGPKCGKEFERLEGWIRHFRKEGVEPLRMAHLVLGKAAFLSADGCGLEGLEFPSTVQEFLQIDPPVEE